MENAIAALIDRHVAAFRRGDLDGLMADYAADAVMITKGTGPLFGAPAIRAAYTTIFAHVFPPGKTTLTFEPAIVARDMALLHFTAATERVRTVGAFDSFVIRDGLIVGQTGGGEFVSETAA